MRLGGSAFLGGCKEATLSGGDCFDDDGGGDLVPVELSGLPTLLSSGLPLGDLAVEDRWLCVCRELVDACISLKFIAVGKRLKGLNKNSERTEKE